MPPPPLLSCLDAVRLSFASQWSLLFEFWRDKRFRAPMLAIWVSVFGGALHDPVSTFFMLRLGATTVDIGRVGVIGSIGSLLMAPFYGYLLDKRGPFLAIILVLVLCTVGCLIRGLATEMYWYYVGQCVLGFGGGNLTTVVIAFVTSSTSRERRTLVMSGALLPAAARCCSLLLTAVHCMHPAASRCCPLLLTAAHCGPLLIAAALYTNYICL